MNKKCKTCSLHLVLNYVLKVVKTFTVVWYPWVVAGPPSIGRYAFVIDGRGRTLHHPLMPSRFRESSVKDRPLLNIHDLETATKAKSVIEYMKRLLENTHCSHYVSITGAFDLPSSPAVY